MERAVPLDAVAPSGPDAPARLVLLVTGDAPRSQRARVNLAAMLRASGRSDVRVDEVDLLEHPRTAATYGVFATPALLWATPHAAEQVLYGDLSDATALRRFLTGVLGAEPGQAGAADG